MPNKLSAASLLWLALLAGCGRQSVPNQPSDQERSAAEMADRISRHSRRAGPHQLVLGDGSCLDLPRIAAPWSVDTDPDRTMFSNGVVISADGGAAGLRPWRPSPLDGSRDIWGEPKDERIRVAVSGWSPPSPEWASYMVAAPARIDELVRTGDFKPIRLWSDDPKGLEAYQGLGGRSYVDSRRLVQCRDYTNPRYDRTNLVWCTAVNRREDVQIGFRFDADDVPRLPQALRAIEQAIEATRTECPAPQPRAKPS